MTTQFGLWRPSMTLIIRSVVRPASFRIWHFAALVKLVKLVGHKLCMYLYLVTALLSEDRQPPWVIIKFM